MTMTHALNEAESVGLGKPLREGKERTTLCFIEDKAPLWKKSEPFMQTCPNYSIQKPL
ncbi:hypothetical protein pah_c045o026 [Parachlamydia acanthamoebae str. Hall's coccus]|nr:hypothetical protein pah_c045o026 [Parachlamydia acanthamoebae str. Hall's coccus]